MKDEAPPIEDARLVAIARDGSLGIFNGVSEIEKLDATTRRRQLEAAIRELAAECLRHRRTDRLDSRRAGQVRKLRHVVNAMHGTLISRLAELEEGDTPDVLASKEPPWLADAAEALGAVAPDGTPLAMNWVAVLREIGELRTDRDRLRLAISEMGAAIGARQ